jgi:hypothetical protein
VKSRFDAAPDACVHQWRNDGVVIDTYPEIHTEYCERCPAYREMLVGNGCLQEWSEPKVHPRFRGRQSG